MGIKSIKIINLLSFSEVLIGNIEDINCLIGQNNAGKSNLLKLVSYFYDKMEGKKVVTPNLNSNYTGYGSISITFDTTRIRTIVTSSSTNTDFQKHIYNILFSGEPKGSEKAFFKTGITKKSSYKLTLFINKDDSISWSSKNKDVLDVLRHLYPFFAIDARHIDLHDWDQLWLLVSKLRSFNFKNLKTDNLIDYFDKSITDGSGAYKEFVSQIQQITNTATYSYQDKVLNCVKLSLKGHRFNIDGADLAMQSDGTNSHKYIELFLTLLISLTRRDYITPTLFLDEPEIGLHPKRNEELITRLYDVYYSFKKTKEGREIGKYKTPYPKIIISTHSPNILKNVIKLFHDNHQVLHFSNNRISTQITVMNSVCDDKRFLNIFSDNEARLFFSHFILFVEGETELELFGNLKLINKFPKLRLVDTYKMDDVTLNFANPSHANLSIPYLVLYDSDVLFDVQIPTGKISIKNQKINLKRESKKIGRTFYSREKLWLDCFLKDLTNNGMADRQLTQNKVDFVEFNLSDFVGILNNKCLHNLNVRLTHTTIEGCLITPTSLPLFLKWIEYEVLTSGEEVRCEVFKKIIKKQINNSLEGALVATTFKALFSKKYNPEGLAQEQKDFLIKVKRKYYFYVWREIRNAISEEEILLVFRAVFNGKVNTLVGISNDKYNFCGDDFKKIVKDLKQKHLRKISKLFTKTSGWVSLFMNFSIDYIEKSQEHCGDGAEFQQEFKRLFPELYDILMIASDSIE